MLNAFLVALAVFICVGGAELVGEHVDVGGAFQYQVRFLPAGGCVDDAALFQQLPVDLARVTLRHRTTPSIEFS